MSKFERKVSRSLLSDYEKVEEVKVKKSLFKEYVKFDWLVLTPMTTLGMFGIYVAMALLIEPFLVAKMGMQGATILTHTVFTSLGIVIFLNGKNGTKAGIKELAVRYLMMAVIFGIGTMITSTLLFK